MTWKDICVQKLLNRSYSEMATMACQKIINVMIEVPLGGSTLAL